MALVVGCGAATDDPSQSGGDEGPQTGETGGTNVTAASIGPAGGTITLDDGFSMSIPAGAVDVATNITVRVLTESPHFAAGPAYALEPAGLKFAQPISITLPVFPRTLPPSTVRLLTGYQFDPGMGDFEAMDTPHATDTDVTVEAWELSTYTSGSPLPHVIATGEDYPQRIATDDTHVFWSSGGNEQRKLAYGNDGVIVRAPIAGGLIEVLTPAQPDPVGVAVNDTHVYWVNAGDGDLWQGEGTGGAVMRAAKSGGSIEKLSDEHFPQAIALDSKNVFWTDADLDQIRMMPLDGGAVTILASDQGDPRHLALYGNDVFYTTGSWGVVAKVSKGGGAPVVLSSEGGKTTAITAQDGFVYWTNELNGTVRRVAVSGGMPITLRNATLPSDVVVHGTELFFTDIQESNVYSMPVAGGVATILASDQAMPWNLQYHQPTGQLIVATAGKYDFEGGVAKVALP